MARLRSGPLLMVIASVVLTAMVGLVKVTRADLSAVEVLWWRSLVSVPIAAALAWRGGVRVVNRRWVFLRCFLGFTAAVAYFTAPLGLPLAEISLISLAQPVLIALWAPQLLGAGEKSGGFVWGMLVLGLAGCVLIVAPGLSLEPGGHGWYAGIALVGALLSSGAHTSLRKLGQTERPATVVFWFQVSVFAFSSAWLLVAGQGIGSAMAYLPHLLGIGVLANLLQLLITEAYRRDAAPVVAAARYTQPVFGALADLLFFAALPAWNVWLGGGLVMAAGLFLLVRKPVVVAALP